MVLGTRTDFNTHAMPFDFPTRQIPTMRPGKKGFDSERSRGVGGDLDGLEDVRDGVFLPPVPLKCSDEILKQAARSLGANLIHVRKATLMVPTNTRPRPRSMKAQSRLDRIQTES